MSGAHSFMFFMMGITLHICGLAYPLSCLFIFQERLDLTLPCNLHTYSSENHGNKCITTALTLQHHQNWEMHDIYKGTYAEIESVSMFSHMYDSSGFSWFGACFHTQFFAWIKTDLCQLGCPTCSHEWIVSSLQSTRQPGRLCQIWPYSVSECSLLILLIFMELIFALEPTLW